MGNTAATDDRTRALVQVKEYEEAGCNMLVTPAALSEMPPMYRPAVVQVSVPSFDTAAGWVYPVAGGDDDDAKAKLGLSKPFLMMLSAAAGVTWLWEQCRRLDDGSDPYYCRFRAVCRMTNFDGSRREIGATKEMDLRDGSPLVSELNAQAQRREERIARKYNRKPNPAKMTAENQIRQLRAHIESHAETKAMLRAVRAAMGVKTSYTKGELEKPFVVCKMVWTPPDDPEINRMIAARELGMLEAMYPGGSPAVPALGAGGASGGRMIQAPARQVGSAESWSREEVPDDGDDDAGSATVNDKPASAASSGGAQKPAETVRKTAEGQGQGSDRGQGQGKGGSGARCMCFCGCTATCAPEEVKASEKFGVRLCKRCNPESADHDAARHQEQ